MMDSQRRRHQIFKCFRKESMCMWHLGTGLFHAKKSKPRSSKLMINLMLWMYLEYLEILQSEHHLINSFFHICFDVKLYWKTCKNRRTDPVFEAERIWSIFSVCLVLGTEREFEPERQTEQADKVHYSVCVHTSIVQQLLQALREQQVSQSLHFGLQLSDQFGIWIFIDHSVTANLFGTVSISGTEPDRIRLY